MGAGARRAIGERGRERVATHYSIDAIARQYVALYRSVAGSN